MAITSKISSTAPRYRDVGGTSDQRTQLSTARVDQAYDGWWVVSEFEFQQWVESHHSPALPE
jgi:hypothetical protein